MPDPLIALANGLGVTPESHQRKQRWLRKMINGRYGEIIIRQHRKRISPGYLAFFQQNEGDTVYTGWSKLPEDAVRNLCFLINCENAMIETNKR